MNNFTSADIQRHLFPTPSAAQRQAAIDRLYRDGLARGLELEAEGLLVVEWEPDAEEQAEIFAVEAKRKAAWNALTTEEQDAAIEASEEEYSHRYDQGYR